MLLCLVGRTNCLALPGPGDSFLVWLIDLEGLGVRV